MTPNRSNVYRNIPRLPAPRYSASLHDCFTIQRGNYSFAKLKQQKFQCFFSHQIPDYLLPQQLEVGNPPLKGAGGCFI